MFQPICQKKINPFVNYFVHRFGNQIINKIIDLIIDQIIFQINGQFITQSMIFGIKKDGSFLFY